MTREYGNRRSSRSRGNAPHQLLVITFTFLLGYLTASFFDFEMLSNWVNTQVLAHHEMKKEASKPEAQHAAIPPKPKFEFYTLLTNEKVPSSQPNANPTASAQPTATNTPTTTVTAAASVSPATQKNVSASISNTTPSVTPAEKQNVAKAPVQSNASSTEKGKFLVQVASFKARKDAEQMKGSLILKGFGAYIIPVSHPVKGNWFRVVVGPYSNRALAQQAQVTLARNERLNGMVTRGA